MRPQTPKGVEGGLPTINTDTVLLASARVGDNNKSSKVTESKKLKAMADSGATRSLTGDRNLLMDVRPCKIYVRCANNEVMLCEHVGDLIVSTGKHVLVLRDVLYVPGAPLLISVSQLTNDLNLKLLFTKQSLEFYRSIRDVSIGKPLLRSHKKLTDKLWYVDLKGVQQYKNRYKVVSPFGPKKSDEASYLCWINRIKPDVDANILHRRYAHANLKYLQIRFPHLRHVKKLTFCDSCAAMEGRQPYRKKYSVDRDRKMKFKVAHVNSILEHMQGTIPLPNPEAPTNSIREETLPSSGADMEQESEDSKSRQCTYDDSDVYIYQYSIDPESKGPDGTYFGRYFSSDTKYVKTESVRGYKYLFIVVDKDTKVTFGFLGTYKSDFTPIILSWLKVVKSTIGRFPGFWKFDSGTEFLNQELVNELRKEGIQLLFTTTGAHNQNPIVERKIGVIWEAVLTTLADSGVPMQFWCYCSQYMITVLNHVPNRGIEYRVPLTAAKLKLLDVLFLVFGCEVWWRDEYAVSNQTWSQRGVFLGISQLKQGYDILDIATGRIFQTRNIKANESRCPFRDALQPCRIQLDFGTWPRATPEEKVSVPSTSFKNTAEERGDSRSHVVDIPLQNSSGQVLLQPPPILGPQILDPDMTVVDPSTPPQPSTPKVLTPQNLSKVLTPQNLLSPLSPPRTSPVLLPSTEHRDPHHQELIIDPKDTASPERSKVPGNKVTPPSTSPLEERKVVSPIDLDLDIFNSRLEFDDKDEQGDTQDFWQSYPTLNVRSELEARHPVINIPHIPTNDITKILPTTTTTAGDPESRPTKVLKPRNPLFPHVHLRLQSKPKPLTKPRQGSKDGDKTSGPRRMFLDLNEEVPTPREVTSDKEPTPTPYPIEKILDRKWVCRGKGVEKYDYLVRWEGDFQDSWIPGANLRNSQKLLREFNKTAPPVDVPPRIQKPLKPKAVNKGIKVNKKVKFSLPDTGVSHSHNLRPRKAQQYVSLSTEFEPSLSRILETPPSQKYKKVLVHRNPDLKVYNPKELSNFAKAVRKTEKQYLRVKDLPDIHMVNTMSADDYLSEMKAPTKFTTPTIGTKLEAPCIATIAASVEAKADTDRERTPVNRPTVNIRDIPTFEEDEFFSKEYKFSDDNPKVAEKVPMGKPEYNVEFTPWEKVSLEELLKDSELAIRELLKLDQEVISVSAEITPTIDPSTKVPKTRKVMLEGKTVKEFLEAEERELLGIHKHGTFEKVYCPKDRRPITCRWVYDLKRNAKGEIILFKARLVVHGYKQLEGIDFNKTFSSTVQVRTFRVLMALAVERGLKITQYDISNAFLNGALEEEIYMEWPPGYPSKDKGTVVKLLKGLYGLKQASRIWQKTLQTVFAKVDMVTCKTESGVLRSTRKGVFALASTWVDDLALLCDNEDYRLEIEETLKKEFLVKCLGELEHYVGIVVEREIKDGRDTITIHQKPYNERVAKEYGPNFKMKATVPAPDYRLSKEDCPVTDEEKAKISYKYINATGSLLYSVICTRPDLNFATMQLARFNSNPGAKHVRASQQAVAYLGNTAGFGLRFTNSGTKSGKIKIIAYVDSDWAGCPDTRRSTMGYIIQIAGGPVSYKSKLMATLALSSCEAEFMALTEVCRELMWLCRFFDEIGVEYETPEIYCDSSSAIAWSQDPIQHQRNKHMELKYYFVRDCVEHDCVKIFKIHTTVNSSDMMTKPVGFQILKRLAPVAHGYAQRNFEEIKSERENVKRRDNI